MNWARTSPPARDRWWRSIKVLLQYAEAMEAEPDQARSTTEFMIPGWARTWSRSVTFQRQEGAFESRHAAIFNNYDQLFTRLSPTHRRLNNCAVSCGAFLAATRRIPAPHPKQAGSSSRCRPPTPNQPNKR